ncbi:MAG: molybdopterin molybdotransferase MoeA [Phycisphaerae bacterium]|nr:molybdopterin molybdotransferase MoeA [Phycisphaerae bacterium]
MMNFDTARKLLADQVEPLPPVEMGLAEALGCRLAETPRADTDLPAADVAVMDGYAARAGELASGAALPVAFEIPAGRIPRRLPPASVARIFTGAMIPDGADTVVPQEQARVPPDGKVLLDALPSGSFIRRRAEVCSVSAPLGTPGNLITPQLIALLSAAGADTVRVIPRPRVAVLSTGSELVPIHQQPGPGQIRDSNGVTLAALVRAAGFELSSVASVADELPALRKALQHASSQADLIATCGGVSVGDYDLVPQALRDVGGETIFHRLAIKPGRPVLSARLGQVWVVGLPGNPVSALVDWRLFAYPLGQRLAGNPHALQESPEPGILVEPARNPGDRTIFAPALLHPGRPVPQVTILPSKGSHDVATAARAHALARLDIGADLAAGDEVQCFRLDAGEADLRR